MRRDDEAARLPRVTRDVERDDADLRAEPPRDLVDELRARDRRAVDADLVGAVGEQPGDVVDRPDPSPDGEGDEDLLGGLAHDVVHRVAVVDGRLDVEEGDLVGALLEVPP